MKRTIKNMVALVMVLLLVLITACAPVPEEVTPAPAPEPAPAPSPVPEDNFRLLISDEVNAIGDFESLVVTISSVGVHEAGENGGWLEFSPATEELDLVTLQGEKAEEIWSGNLTEGQYTMAFIYVSDIDAELNTGNSTEVKLPSEKLHINTNFNIPEDSPVDFVFDISVVAAGSEQSGIKYILKPVVSQSGLNQKFTEVSKEKERERERERERLSLELEGNIAPSENVTLLVTFEGEPVAGATVEVNGEEIGETGDDGTISFPIPEDADNLEIKVEKGKQEGELEFEFEKELEGELTLEIVEGNIAPSENVTLLVTFEDQPIAGANVEVNGEDMGETGDDGIISFTIPEDADDLKVEAKLGGREGKLELEFEEQ